MPTLTRNNSAYARFISFKENQAAGHGPPQPGGYVFARWAGRSGFYYSPLHGPHVRSRAVQPGGLTRDADTVALSGRP
ncbi:MAG: hypothetical protein DMF48_07855 [Verrucomicrobia bacterium]|nr:MAG: hypothetical protein DMF48_07855 [Verrucomicrobiota bacterium]